MTRSLRIIPVFVAFLALSGIVWMQDAPKEPPKDPAKTNEQKEPAPDPALTARIEELIKQLGDEDFEKREAAHAELIRIGRPVWQPVQKAMNESDDFEVRTRAAAIAEQISSSIFTLIGKNAQGYEEYRHEKTGMVFVKLPGGAFNMGSDNGRENENPLHEVRLNGFMISKYEVTQAVWQNVMRNEAPTRPDEGGDGPSKFKGENNPVEQVSWDNCDAFCKKAKLRLPTEAEWEYACRAGTTTKYYWGDEPDGDYMWYDKNSGNTTHPVGQKKPNAFGLFDMSGNVFEWCADSYKEDYYKKSPHDNPGGPVTAEVRRLLRGGSWVSTAFVCRSAHRESVAPSGWTYCLGFRCVVSDLPR